jgi:hypothetical protein
MKLGLNCLSNTSLTALFGLAIPLALASTACSGSNGNPGNLLNPPNQDGGVQPTNNGPPHALAQITIGEAHASGNSSSEAIVEATFIPDVSAVTACATSVAGCSIAVPATCDGVTGPLCQGAQTCVLDASCKPTCQATCTVQCPTGEECYFSSGSTQSCRAIQHFDAGDLVFSGPGLASGITLFPPDYTYSSSNGNPIVPGGQIQVTATGTTQVGFSQFQESFKATTLLQTIPALSTLTAANVFNPQGLALGWQPGADAILVTVAGPKGAATCNATDATGAYTVPAQVISAVAGTGNTSLEIAVTRQRVEHKTDGHTQGTLLAGTVQPVGYIDLMTVSSETTSVSGVQGCTTGTSCSGICVDLTSSNTNCGACGHYCTAGTACSAGVCATLPSTCVSPLTSCGNTCVNLSTSTSNCGFCGNACTFGDTCVSGTCTVPNTCGTLTSCADGCQNLQTSNTDCGTCGNSCGTGTCSGGTCTTSTTTCTTCEASAETGTCVSQYTACSGDSNCSSYATCMNGCTAGDTLCQTNCQSSYPTGATEARNLRTCICTTACPSSCGTAAYCTETL